MTQNQINREVANATGESIHTINQRGFELVSMPSTSSERDREPLVVDWDELETRREVRHPVVMR